MSYNYTSDTQSSTSPNILVTIPATDPVSQPAQPSQPQASSFGSSMFRRIVVLLVAFSVGVGVTVLYTLFPTPEPDMPQARLRVIQNEAQPAATTVPPTTVTPPNISTN
jgi:hypothetical protein